MLETYIKLNILTELCEVIEHNPNSDLKSSILKVVNADLDEVCKSEILNFLYGYLKDKDKQSFYKYVDHYIGMLVESMQIDEADDME